MPLFIGGLWQCAWLVIFAAIGTAVPPTENPAAGIVMIVAACKFELLVQLRCANTVYRHVYCFFCLNLGTLRVGSNRRALSCFDLTSPLFNI